MLATCVNCSWSYLSVLNVRHKHPYVSMNGFTNFIQLDPLHFFCFTPGLVLQCQCWLLNCFKHNKLFSILLGKWWLFTLYPFWTRARDSMDFTEPKVLTRLSSLRKTWHDFISGAERGHFLKSSYRSRKNQCLYMLLFQSHVWRHH